ncbi:12621_t:CDS:2 [Entrophospora sp. SA101]|nr:12621_t:CDS:2 [Entrophospora sp. SA101]
MIERRFKIKPISNEFTNFYKPSPTRSQQAPQSTILPPLSSGSETPTSPTDAAAPTPTSQINTSGASSTHKQTGFVIILASFPHRVLRYENTAISSLNQWVGNDALNHYCELEKSYNIGL